ncbi:ATP-binding protein [Flexistipes sp.]|uniref:ATP-binding protein n=1 Tax=Flexistipes sp. TaxID=3088135 RepID=UPI002E207480|nr:ATP-binding protein [Flexistipes sp.]
MNQKQFEEIISLKTNGRMQHKESQKLEFKANFNFSSMNEYSKIMAAFANNAGGIIVFGVKDKPRSPIGVTNNNFFETDNEKISNYLNEHFAPVIDWESDDFEINGKNFGTILVNESNNKPVVCKKETKGQKAREGDIFYRYSARNDRIKYPDLSIMLEKNRLAEQKKWMELIENIAEAGPQNIMLMDVLRGEIPSSTDAKIIIDKELLEKIKFVQEGHFVEKNGAPALKLVGTVKQTETVVPNFNLDEDFLTTKELAERLGLLSEKGSTNYMTAVIWKYNIQNNSKFFQKKRGQKFYSKLALEHLQSKNITLDQAKQALRDYNTYKKSLNAK